MPSRQLLQIRTRKLGEAVLAATEGLAEFPRLGRAIPEQEQFPQLVGTRDLTIRNTMRVLYEYDRRKEVAWILGLLFRGQRISLEALGLPEKEA